MKLLPFLVIAFFALFVALGHSLPTEDNPIEVEQNTEEQLANNSLGLCPKPCQGKPFQETPLADIEVDQKCGTLSTSTFFTFSFPITPTLNAKLPSSYHSCCKKHTKCYGNASETKGSCDIGLQTCFKNSYEGIDASKTSLRNLLQFVDTMAYAAVSLHPNACNVYTGLQNLYVGCR